MTPEEAFEFGRCTACVRAWQKRVRDWKAGRTVDPELDEAKAAGLKF